MKFSHIYNTVKQIVTLPKATLSFRSDIDPVNIVATYHYYTKWHPRYKFIRHKTLGAALIDLQEIDTREKYLALAKGKNGGAHHAKRARARGYVFSKIDRNDHVDSIHRIHTSSASRQGRPMDASYQRKINHFDSAPHFRCFGIINENGELVAYATIGLFGNFCGFSQLIGFRNNEGIMHLLLFEIVCSLIEQQQVRYVMYDTFFGALPGMRLFKTMLGFRPYRAKYVLL